MSGPGACGRRTGAARRILRGALVLAGVLACGGCALAPASRFTRPEFALDAESPRAIRNAEVFERVWRLVAERHHDPALGGLDWTAAGRRHGPAAIAAADDESLYRELNAMLEPLKDSHTRAVSPARAAERRARTRARTGFAMERLEGRWVVNEVLPGSPAESAGIRAGWVVVARDGRPLGEDIDFRPTAGEGATWEFLDEQDRPVRVAPVARELTTAPRREERMLPGGIPLLRFDEFDASARRWLSERLKARADAPGVVIDLRRNSGGETFSLGIVIGEFFAQAVDCGVFVTRAGTSAVKSSWQWGSARYAGRVVVLVDRGTASAAEIFAAVMQDHGRATVMGRPTAGAVLASWFYELPDGGQLQLSREDYLAPKGRRLEGRGVEPDQTLPRTLADLRTGRDRDIEAALRWMAGPPSPDARGEGSGRP